MQPALLTREDALAIYHSGSEATISLLLQMQESIVRLQQNAVALDAQVRQLKAQLDKDSHNSSKPPSSDGLAKKPVSLRPAVGQSGRKSGGQAGHDGHTLEWRENPDQVVFHSPTICSNCGEALPSLSPEEMEQLAVSGRQVHDLPPQTLQVTEHRTVCQSCPHCHCANTGEFPSEVSQSVQYGPNVNGLCVYLQCFQLLPYARVTQLMGDIWGVTPSQGTLANLLERASRALAPVEKAIVSALQAAPVLHVDETGMRSQGCLHWLHSASTPLLTYYAIHAKRGCVAMDAHGILPVYGGIVVHDAFASYWNYTSCKHALCNAHLLRELTAQHETGESWAKPMMSLLCEIKGAVAAAVEAAQTQLAPRLQADFERRYQTIVQDGLKQHPPPQSSGRRGRIPQGSARNLLLRLDRRRSEVLRFMSEFAVPFDNNLAERDLRMVKVRNKISGSFRSIQGGTQFCRIRGYISTLRKQKCPLLRPLQALFQGNTFWPPSLNDSASAPNN